MNLHHTLREVNACAGFMAKFEASQDEALVFDETPLVGMSLFLLTDAMGTTSMRP